jgi:N-acetyl-alpha-D-muramate 1-phosphate uridylyltransferase
MLRPKALCPVNNRPMLDLAIQRLRPFVTDIAVNAHYMADQIVDHLANTDVKISVEAPEVLGTAGAIGALRDWIGGRPVLIHNADAWISGSLDDFVAGWLGVTPRLLVTLESGHADFGDRRFVGVSLLPGAVAASLPAQPSGLYEEVWREAFQQGGLELIDFPGTALDCGTIEGYLRANLLANNGRSVIGQGAVVRGQVIRSVVWDGCTVSRGEWLVNSVRATNELTVQASNQS